MVGGRGSKVMGSESPVEFGDESGVGGLVPKRETPRGERVDDSRFSGESTTLPDAGGILRNGALRDGSIRPGAGTFLAEVMRPGTGHSRRR
ncbi:MAG: hypothetical protein EA421_03190 [Gemmatimonadales bacterium]|nr:MAG: hypothetical protein EA421_03190 [Gemmatimonadales bacterium]